MPFNFPPLDSSLLFHDLINFHMEKNPSFPAFAYAAESLLHTPTEISFLEFGRAAHRVAHALRPSCQGRDGDVVMLIANTDTILHHAVVAGLMLAGWVPFLVSPRNSPTAVAHMMNKTNCQCLVTLDHAHKNLIDNIRREMDGAPLNVYELPTLRYTFPRLGHETVTDPFDPYTLTFKRPDLDSPALYLHSSGSTGFPKPIPHTHRVQINWLTRAYLQQCTTMSLPRRVAVMSLPPFHAFGFATGLYGPFAALVTTVVYAPQSERDPLAQPVIPTSENMTEVLKKIPCNVLTTVPTFLEQMAMSEAAVEVLKKMDSVVFGGGPLPVKVGDKLWAAGVQLASSYGATETGAPVGLTDKCDSADGDWMWLRLIDDWKVRWISQGDDTYELQLLQCERYRLPVLNIPDIEGYATSDIFVKHPTKDAWRTIGRTDDVIVLASGEKTVPVPLEGVIASSTLVQGVLMFGSGRNQVGVLVEPRVGHTIDVDDEKAVTEFKNKIWPIIEEANKTSPAFSRIFREMVLITRVDKPMLRTAKGTVQRKMTLNSYQAEITALYDNAEAHWTGPDNLAVASDWTNEAVGQWLLEHARAINSNCNVDSRKDLFAQGFDSLSATSLRNRIMGALLKSSDRRVKNVAARIPPSIVYENPTILQLSSRLVELVKNNDAGQGLDVTEKHRQDINAMIEKHTVGLGGLAKGSMPHSPPIVPATVLLTGSTGGLGSFLLSELLRSTAVQRVFALNRPSATPIEERQKSAFEDKGLTIGLLDSTKLVYVVADASMERCGLSRNQYEEIRNSVTLIIHNAWRVDFNLALASFEDIIRASRNLVDLALGSPLKEHLRLLFMSSIGSAQSWNNSNGPFPEEMQLDSSIAVGPGYGEGKYVTERIVLKSGLHATSLRIGQIVGGRGGGWATKDWFPIIVKSSIELGALPEAAGVVSWLREEDVAAAVLDVAFATETPPPTLNVVNPQSVPWANIITFVRRAIIQRKEEVFNAANSLPIIPFGDWFALLEKKAEGSSEDDLNKIPAIKLLDFLRVLAKGDQAIRTSAEASITTEAAGMLNCSTTKAQHVSPAMAKMQAVGEVEADAWVGYWTSRGAF